RLSNTPVLARFDPALPIQVRTDGSSIGISAVLNQVQPDGTIKPVACLSQKLNDSQKRLYAATEIECYAIWYALKKWHHYLDGQKFEICTDHRALQFIRSS